MVVIRLSRGGSKNRPFYNVVVADSRNRRDGRFIERIGFYNPLARGGDDRLDVGLGHHVGLGAGLDDGAALVRIDAPQRERAAARAHLAASIYVQMALKPHIIHIVGHTEADHAATADDVIEASQLARRAIQNALAGQPDLTADLQVQARCDELVSEAQLTLAAIRAIAPAGVAEPLTDPETLAQAVTLGILDAPQLVNNQYGRGQVKTRIIRGACLPVDSQGNPLKEADRLDQVLLDK